MATSEEIIVFKRGYYDGYDPDPDSMITIPIEESLQPVPSDVIYRRPEESLTKIRHNYIGESYGPFVERSPTQFSISLEFAVSGNYDWMQVRWVPQRDEWVAIAYCCEPDGGWHTETYHGPWSIDAYCFSRLLQAYGIRPDTFSIEHVKHLSPEQLHKLSASFKMALESEFWDHYVERFEDCSTILDTCAGVGFLSVALAKKYKIIAVEIDSMRLNEAKKLAQMKNVKITFISGDILNEEVLKRIDKIDAAFLDPDWKRDHSVKPTSFDFYKMEPPLVELFTKIQAKTENIALRLPKETNFSEFDRLISAPYELEECYLNEKLIFYTVYFGKLAKIIGRTQFKT